jgi:hypothetical protein
MLRPRCWPSAIKKTESSDNKWDMTPGLYMRTYDEMMEAFIALNAKGTTVSSEVAHKSLLTSAEIVEKCDLWIPKFDVCLPDIDTSELGTDDPDTALLRLCVRGWNSVSRLKRAVLKVAYISIV